MHKLLNHERDTLLSEGLPYHAQGLVLLVMAVQQLEKKRAGNPPKVSLNGQAIAPNILLNALLESGAVHLRYLSEFLGVTVSAAGERTHAKARQADDLRVDALSTQDHLVEPVTWGSIETSCAWPGFSDALRNCLVAANKLVAHPTAHLVGARNRASSEDIIIAAQGILTLLVNRIYAPLGYAEAFVEKCPGIERCIAPDTIDTR